MSQFSDFCISILFYFHSFYSLIHAIIMSTLSVYALTTDMQLWRDPIW